MAYPILYALTSGADVLEVAVALAPKKFEWLRFGYDDIETTTENDYNDDLDDIFSDPKIAEGYLSAPSQSTERYDVVVVDGASPEQVKDYKSRLTRSFNKIRMGK